MRNKIMIIAVLLAVMAAMTGIVEADTPILLTNSNNAELNGIVIKATPDGATGKIVIELITNPVINTPLGIDQFFYNLTGNCNGRSCVGDWNITNVEGDTSSEAWTWRNKNGTNADGFGKFLSHRSKNPGGTGGLTGYPITFTLKNPFTDIPPNPTGGRVAVHIRFQGCSGWISDGTTDFTPDDPNQDAPTTLGCTRPPNNDIPEFPTVAFPVAAVIGLVFFFQQRKKKEE